MPVITSGVRYSGRWNLQAQAQADSAGTWPVPFTYLWVWGMGGNGRLGVGNTTNYSSPVQLGAGDNWAVVNGGFKGSYGMGIKADGTLWGWGNNGYGNLGLGTTTHYSSPVQVGALTTWSSVSTGYGATLAIKTDGTLWAWGNAAHGQLGHNNTTTISSPVQVGALTDWASVAVSGANSGSTAAVKTDGTLWTWGANTQGQLGDGTTTNTSSPVQVGALTTWKNVCTGSLFTVATATDGTLWSWGANNSGQLGVSNTTYYSSPVQVGALTNWVVRAGTGGQDFCAVVKTDGTLWTWGLNSGGQLGLGNYTTVYNSPNQVGALTTWADVVARDGYTTALTTTQQLWSIGYDSTGGLGTGATKLTNSPIQVGALTSWISVFPAPDGSCYAIQE